MARDEQVRMRQFKELFEDDWSKTDTGKKQAQKDKKEEKKEEKSQEK